MSINILEQMLIYREFNIFLVYVYENKKTIPKMNPNVDQMYIKLGRLAKLAVMHHYRKKSELVKTVAAKE